jgi:uncharacterized OB-fold protein
MSLLEREHDVPQAWRDALPVTSRYSFGVAGERFFQALKNEGVIYGAYCEECDVTYVPARMFCERCLGELQEWIDVGLTGEVYTFTFLFQNLDGTPREDPEIVALIRMHDGGLVHRLGEVAWEQVAIGMPVEAVLKPKNEREGSILDIAYFKPAT